MIHLSAHPFRAAMLAASLLVCVSAASAQDGGAPRPPGLLDNLFGGNASAQPIW
jgi:hypothetical protein